jgi:hypothetical protein
MGAMTRAHSRLFIMIRACAAVCAVALAAASARAAETADCHVGVYRLSDQSIVEIIHDDDTPLSWVRFDGTRGGLTKTSDDTYASSFGWTGRPDGKSVRFTDCAAGDIVFDGTKGHRIALDVANTTFQGHGVKLVGRLMLPKGNAPVPIVVLVHGAEHDSALDSFVLQWLLPAEGVGAFVYDKRGTGQSGGTYSQDFNLLADDAVAAMREARRLAGSRAGRVGYHGGSEGGWVAPMAANRAPVDFVIVAFGLAISVIEEDQEEVALEMREEGHSQAEIDDARKVARAAENVFASGFTTGFAELDGLRAKYRGASWYKDLHGNYTWMLLPHSEAELRAMAPKYRWNTPFAYDPMATLRAGTTPQLWILGSEDYAAPSAETSRRIKSLMAEGHPFTLAIFPGAEHGIEMFEGKNSDRVDTRYAPGYFAMIRDYARDGRLKGPYGDATITR